MVTYVEKERRCMCSFAQEGPYWHIFTPGKDTPLIFCGKDDYVFAMNAVAQAAFAFKDVKIVAFEIMNNHFHALVSGERASVEEFFGYFRKRLAKGIARDGHAPLPQSFLLKIKEVTDLAAMRNTIVYINRNGYVADHDYTPFSYPWGTNRYYFCDFPVVRTYRETTTVERRRMFRGRIPFLPDSWPVVDGYVAPDAYCHIGFGMAVFRDAHHYFAAVSKNVEAYREIAGELDDGEFLTDAELFAKLVSLVRDTYHVNGVRDLSKAQKHDLARTLRYSFRSSNGQIRRLLGLTGYEVDSMFPLSSE